MEIINKKSADYQLHQLADVPRVTFRFGANSIGFNLPAIIQFKMKYGDYVHFVADLDRIYFYINKDASGLQLKSDGVSLRITSLSIRTMLMKRFPEKIVPGSTFKIRQLVTKINEERAYEIQLNTKRMTEKKVKRTNNN